MKGVWSTSSSANTKGIHVWVASASVTGGSSAHAHLVPLSLAWIDERAVIALEPASRTARNLAEQGPARLALGPTRDVVIIDAVPPVSRLHGGPAQRPNH